MSTQKDPNEILSLNQLKYNLFKSWVLFKIFLHKQKICLITQSELIKSGSKNLFNSGLINNFKTRSSGYKRVYKVFILIYRTGSDVITHSYEIVHIQHRKIRMCMMCSHSAYSYTFTQGRNNMHAQKITVWVPLPHLQFLYTPHFLWRQTIRAKYLPLDGSSLCTTS